MYFALSASDRSTAPALVMHIDGASQGVTGLQDGYNALEKISRGLPPVSGT